MSGDDPSSSTAEQGFSTYDPANFQPPAWASGPQFDFARKGTASEEHKPGPSHNSLNDQAVSTVDDEDEEDYHSAEEDLSAAVETTSSGVTFSVQYLQGVLARALVLKAEGNRLFTLKEQQFSQAKEKYREAVDILPVTPITAQTDPPVPESGIQEVTDEQADSIRAQEDEPGGEDSARAKVEQEIRDCAKACWSNLAACALHMNDYNETVSASTKALEIDPSHTKALRRRADANAKLGTWSSLTSAQEDYTKIINLPTSPEKAAATGALRELPEKIKLQQEKEKNEMLGKLKELGDGILGKFGLSTDMFKFDQQEGGGYNLRFER